MCDAKAKISSWVLCAASIQDAKRAATDKSCRRPSLIHSFTFSLIHDFTALLRLRRMRRLLRRRLLALSLDRFAQAQRQFLLLWLGRLIGTHDPLHQCLPHHVPIRKVAERNTFHSL